MERAPTGAPRGASLAETLVVVAVLGLSLPLALPVVAELGGATGLRAASNHVAAHLNRARGLAAARGRDVGIRWVLAGGDATLYFYEDGNWNGVLSADVVAGVDRLVAGPISLRGRYPSIRFSFVPGFRGPDPGGSPIGDLSDPFRLGASNITTFSPVGKASPGTVYLSDERSRQAAVRVSPYSARIQVYEWRPSSRTWEPE
ncbi:hypothetical protein FBQ97_02335 [Acidobacteria bacterium ACD]|nr:MAG: hypothetical protein EDX89_11765 [Acidobacteriota bacterium]MCE7958163.1 hypothetical protein [Acidobacteria bacterium ACB2]MDL1948639.1 hypothetical protein [Acidobacteria bacterium ACD]